jgi:hypothetical protein
MSSIISHPAAYIYVKKPYCSCLADSMKKKQAFGVTVHKV